MEDDDTEGSLLRNDDAALKQAVRIVALLNLVYFGVEFAVALTIRLRLALRRFHRLPRRRRSQRAYSYRSQLFLSARNDALANIAIIAAGLATIITLSAWPDLLVGLGIFLMNLDAAREVYTTALRERSVATGQP